jgi:tetratricopeptide (TPR) repeat protein
VPARSNLATVLYRQGRADEAIGVLDHLIADEPDHMGHANLKAAASARIGDYAEAVRLYEAVLDRHDGNEKIWMSFGHVLKTVGRREDSIHAYRRAIDLRPGYGEVWWSLANLKTVKFSAEDMAAMRTALEGERLDEEDRFHLHFALGKAEEDAGNWEASFHHYDTANTLRRAALPYDAAAHTRMVDQVCALLTPDFFAERPGGCPANDPIFVLGMPRAGSTLIEQILASHSAVEGTQELADILMMAQRIGGYDPETGMARHLEALAALTPDQRTALGEEYLKRTEIYRKTGKPRFVDKMPNNWFHIAFIHLILPNAGIIDARREAMDCCFSNFRQHFARGQSFAYGLSDLGRYYRDYTRLLDAVDQALPGRVHRVEHEALVDDTDTQIRAMLDYLGLPFEEACLNFWQNDRAVQTPSAEQVRRPINRDGMDRWRNYDPWLGELRGALGELARP